MQEHYDTERRLKLLINNGPAEYDPVVCHDELKWHTCYREPFHSGAHCCGGLCDGRNPCLYMWANENTTVQFEPEEQLEEREV